MAEIMYMRFGKVGFLVVWPFVCLTAFFVVTTATQANARTLYAFSRDHGLPDRGFFAKVNKRMGTTINAVWLVVFFCILLGCLGFASYYAVSAIFALAALGMNISYLIPIVLRQIFQDHPDVKYVPGPFTLGRGWLGRIINSLAIFWILFECTILSIPAKKDYNAKEFNYSWVIMFGVLFIAIVWFIVYAHRHYHGPRSSMSPDQLKKLGIVTKEEEDEVFNDEKGQADDEGMEKVYT